MSEFYDENWRLLQRRYSLVARKLEDLRCEVPSQEEFEELLNYVEEIAKRVENLEKLVRRMPHGALIDDEYETKWKPIDDEYETKWKPIDDEFRAKLKLIDDEYKAKLKELK